MAVLQGTAELEINATEANSFTRQIETYSGFTTPDCRVRPGDCRALLDNSTGEFSRFNASSTFNGDLFRGAPVVVKRQTTAIWTGYLDSLEPNAVRSGGAPMAELRAVDALGYYGVRDVYPLPSTGGEPYSTLVHNVLDAMGYLPIANWRGNSNGTVNNAVLGDHFLPSDVQDGDLIVLAIWRNDTLTFEAGQGPTDDGFTQIESASIANGANTFWGRLYTKTASSEPASYSWDTTNSAGGFGTTYVFVVIRDPDGVADSSVNAHAASTSLTASAVTSARNNSLILGIWGQPFVSAATLTPPAGYSERDDIDSPGTGFCNVEIATGIKNIAGSTGSLVATSNQSAVAINFLIAINPSTAAAASRIFEDGKFTAGQWGDGGRSGLAILQDLMSAEGGYLYVNPAGAIVFEGSEHRLGSPHQTSQLTLSDGSATNPYHAIKLLNPQPALRNQIEAHADSYAAGSAGTVLWTLPTASYSLGAGATLNVIAEYPGPEDVTGAFVELWVSPRIGTDVTSTSDSSLLVHSVVRSARRMKFSIQNISGSGLTLTLVQARGKPITKTSEVARAYAEDATSVATHGPKFYAVSGSMASIEDAETRAAMELAKFKDERVSLELRAWSTTNYLARAISDRITVTASSTRTQFSLTTKQCYIDGIGHLIRPGLIDEMTFYLNDAAIVDDLP